MPPRYELRFAGQVDQSAAETFADLEMDSDGTVTTVAGDLDQAALHGLLERLRVLHLDLIDVRRVRRGHAAPN